MNEHEHRLQNSMGQQRQSSILLSPHLAPSPSSMMSLGATSPDSARPNSHTSRHWYSSTSTSTGSPSSSGALQITRSPSGRYPAWQCCIVKHFTAVHTACRTRNKGGQQAQGSQLTFGQTHVENCETRTSKKSGWRKLLSNSRAALDVFQSVKECAKYGAHNAAQPFTRPK